MPSIRKPIAENLTATQREIGLVLGDIHQMLVDKNRRYGDSALNPVRIFSRADALEQINVRLDDKLSRLASGQCDEDEDVEADLIGYLVLRRIARRRLAKGGTTLTKFEGLAS